MNYEILNTPFYKQAINATEVQIYCNAPYTVITRDIVGNVCDKPSEELIKLVIDQVAAEYDPTDKINRLDQTLLKADKAIERMKEESKITQGAIIELMNQVLPFLHKAKEEVTEHAPSNPTANNDEKGGETVDGNATGN
ncbi:hypothetical protein D3H64_05985 [Atopobacter sp. AH10]|uniref:hypothetical protein n=1 Tax=Atopobacter sp. AH10 TaxID=2315861 RepID=UPI000EF1C5A8|nr:hypothetical protein [Atopobacter sp. AH10]RLK63141.1 hypothetical protein D3H64_05985 [Atopobacter sp. AH10]